jgi:thioredoxin reductase
MQELWGQCVFHCPFCDGWGLDGQTVGLYARRYNGYGMALALRQLTEKVILFTDTARYLKPIQAKHLESRDIAIYSQKVASLSSDSSGLTCVMLANGTSVGCTSLFTHNGIRYNNELILQLGVKCNALGATLINKRQECSVPGVYIAGDAAFDMQFVAVAAAEGVKAAVSIHNALMQEDNRLQLTMLS